jgi:hypothetical protein
LAGEGMTTQVIKRPRELYERSAEEVEYIKVDGDFKEYMKELIAKAEKEPREPFYPSVYYNRDGEQLEAYWRDDCSYSEQVNGKDGKGLFSLHRAFDTKEVVGITIYGPIYRAGLRKVKE